MLPIAFAEQAELLDGPQQLPALAPTGKATSCCRRFRRRRSSFPQGTSPMILLSDGIHNSAGSPLDITGKLGMVVHCVGVGPSLRNNLSYRDIMVTGMDCPDRMILNNMARVTGSIDAVGPGRPRGASVSRRGRQADRPGRVDLGRRGGFAAGHASSSAPRSKATKRTRCAFSAGGRRRESLENNPRFTVATIMEAGIHTCCISKAPSSQYSTGGWLCGQRPRSKIILRPGAGTDPTSY